MCVADSRPSLMQKCSACMHFLYVYVLFFIHALMSCAGLFFSAIRLKIVLYNGNNGVMALGRFAYGVMALWRLAAWDDCTCTCNVPNPNYITRMTVILTLSRITTGSVKHMSINGSKG